MLRKLIILATLAGTVAACDVTYPVAVVGPSDTIYRGTATAQFIDGGWFQVQNGTNSCQGHYQPAIAGQTTTFPVKCTNGLSGVGTASFQDGRSGGGMITMQDGTQWQFIFGRGALRI